MKTIRTLQILINLLFYILVGVLTIITLYYLTIFIAPDILPDFLQMPRMVFSFFDWKFFIGPVFSYVNFILFVYGIYLLKKVVPSFKKADFYSLLVIKNLKKVGRIFVFIGLSMIILKLSILLIIQSGGIFRGLGFNTWWRVMFSILGSIDFTMICLVIIGLFFLLFSDSFKNAKEIQQENELTI